LLGWDAMESVAEVFSSQIVIRTRFFDEYLLAATSSCEQVVLVGAGLDTRAFRLPWPSRARLFEADLPNVFTFKEQVLGGHSAVPRCDRHIVRADLREDWSKELVAAGFQDTSPTAWLAEGLLAYLSVSDARRLLTTIGTLSISQSQVAFERILAPESDADPPGPAARTRAISGAEPVTGLWKGGLGSDGPEWMSRQGWQPQFHSRVQLARSYGRPTTDPPLDGFLTAIRA
jgi:methyltransferase (TIGR00027 family)